MRDSQSSDVLLAPFGALMGNIPIDAVCRGRVVGTFGDVLTESGEHMTNVQRQLHSAIDPANSAWRHEIEKNDIGDAID